jgi:two-component system NtrC family sensor kinase
MKLTLKLMSVIVAGIIALTALDVYLTVRREIRLFDTDMKRDALVLGRSVRDLLEHIWRVGGQEGALALIERVNAEGHIIRMRWVWLDGQADELHRPHIPLSLLSPVVRGEELSIKRSGSDDAGYLYSYVPVSTVTGRKGALELSESLSELSQYTGSTVKRAVVLTGGIVLFGGLSAVGFGILFVGRPLRLLSEKAGRVGLGDFTGPLHIPGRDELSELAGTINTMCDQVVESQKRIRAETGARIAALEQLRHADRLKTVGRLASGIAHELGTPLNVVGGRASMIAAGRLSPDELVENARIIKAQSDRMARIIRQLLDFARSRPPCRERADIRNIATQTLSLLATLARKRNVSLTMTSSDAPVWATVDAAQIQQVLTNLVMNALHAMTQAGKVTVSIQCERARPPGERGRADGDYVCVRVEDEGEGISKESMQHIFEPFFTTKDVGEGTGLGLSIAYGIIREHGGWIDVKSELGEGSSFSVFLPREVEECDGEFS